MLGRRGGGYRMASSGDDDKGGQGCPGQREVAHPRSVQSVSQDVIERHVAGPGEREGGGAPPEDGRILETAFAVEEALVDVHGRGDDHRASHRSTRARSAEPDGEQGSPAGFSETGRNRVELARAESEAFKRRAGTLETRSAEPAEQLLSAVGKQSAAHGDPQGEQAEIPRLHNGMYTTNRLLYANRWSFIYY